MDEERKDGKPEKWGKERILAPEVRSTGFTTRILSLLVHYYLRMAVD